MRPPLLKPQLHWMLAFQEKRKKDALVSVAGGWASDRE
jgi:hypothetical protein